MGVSRDETRPIKRTPGSVRGPGVEEFIRVKIKPSVERNTVWHGSNFLSRVIHSRHHLLSLLQSQATRTTASSIDPTVCLARESITPTTTRICAP